MREYKLLIGGKRVPGESTMSVVNPATGDVLAQCPRGSVAQIDAAVASAKAAYPAWAALPIKERAGKLDRMAELIEQNQDEFARLMTQEQGKPLSESLPEVLGAAAFIRFYATLDLPVRVIEDSEVRRVEAQRRPLGVVAAITPWNFPLLLLVNKLAPALLAGNTVVAKPAPTTPLVALLLAELVADVFPAGVLNFVTDQNDLGGVLTRHPDVRKVSFTGSTATGRKVMASAAESVKRVTLELGGNDAAIVMPDADPKEVAPQIFGNAFVNCGQVCLAIKRAYVHESIYDQMCDEMAKLAKGAVVGDGLKEGTQIGPLQNRMQYDKVCEMLEDTARAGKIIAGGKPVEGTKGYFIQPTIVRDVTDGDRIVDEEQFGPILPLIKYKDPEDALKRANASQYGLGGSVWGKDQKAMKHIAARMDTGTVWLNKHLDFGPHIPFGGAKQSGLGVEFAEEGFAEFTQLHVINGAK